MLIRIGPTRVNVFALLILTFGLVLEARAAELLAIDDKTQEITVSYGRDKVTYRYRHGVDVTLNEKKAATPQLKPGMQIYVTTNEPGMANKIEAIGAVQSLADRAGTKPGVDLNKATLAEIEELPGIGPEKAALIIKRRPFTSVAELREIKGIGEKTLAKLRPFVTVAPR